MKKKDLFIHFLRQILDLYEFNLETEKDENGKLAFKLLDLQGANLWDIEGDRFYNLFWVVDRLDVYHNDYIFDALWDMGLYWDTWDELIKLEDKEYDRDLTVAKFVCSDNIADELSKITPKYFEKYHNKVKNNRVDAWKPFDYKLIKNYL